MTPTTAQQVAEYRAALEAHGVEFHDMPGGDALVMTPVSLAVLADAIAGVAVQAIAFALRRRDDETRGHANTESLVAGNEALGAMLAHVAAAYAELAVDVRDRYGWDASKPAPTSDSIIEDARRAISQPAAQHEDPTT